MHYAGMSNKMMMMMMIVMRAFKGHSGPIQKGRRRPGGREEA